MERLLMTLVALWMAGGAYAAEFGTLQSVKAADLKSGPTVEVAAVPAASKGYVEPELPAVPIEWVTIEGSKFLMGTNTSGSIFADARPAHEVKIKTFEMTKTEITVEQYLECLTTLNPATGKNWCTQPAQAAKLFDDRCNWGRPGRELHPVNCVTWEQAAQYARFKGARLPSESEWEYAATSGGKNQKYPWGNDDPTCDKAVMNEGGPYGPSAGYGCGKGGTWPVCSKPAGNTKLDGIPADRQLCDMTGNLGEWVQDIYNNTYIGAPVDGGAYTGPGFTPAYEQRVERGGSFLYYEPQLRADHRAHASILYTYDTIGFRLARTR